MGIISEILMQTGGILLRLIPFAAAGSLLSAFLRVYRRRIFGEKFFKLPGPALVSLCSILGAFSPFCTIGTVPVVIGLLSCGLPAGAGIAFLTASSIVNPQIFMIEVASLGLKLAVVQALSGIGIGITAGMLFSLMKKAGTALLNEKMPAPDNTAPAKKTGIFSIFLDQFEFISFFILAGALLTSAINVLVPPSWFTPFSNMPSIVSALLGTLMSVPLYACGGSVMPVLSMLLGKGISPGFAAAFIIAGPATRIQTVAAVKSLISGKALAGYLALIWAWAIAAGMLVNFIGVL